MSKKQRYGFLIAILIIATFLRFFHFSTTPPGLYPDEAADGNNAVEAAQTGHFQVFYTEDNGREGLYVNIIALILKVYPVFEPWIIRLPAAIAGVLTVWAIYLLTAELFSVEAGLLASFLLATSFWHINFSRIGFRAILAPLLLTWSFYFAIKAFKAAAAKAGSVKAGFWYAILAGVIYSLGFYTYIAYRITPLLFLLFIPFFRKKPEFWKRVAIFVITVFIVAAPIGWYFVKHPADFFGRTAQISVTNAQNPVRDFAVNLGKTLLMLNVRGDSNWRHNVSGAPELFWPVGIIFLIGLALAVYSLWKGWRKKMLRDDKKNMFPLFSLLAVFGGFILAILPAAASDEGIPHALRSILMLPPAIMFAAVGGVWAYDFIKRRWNASAARVIATVFIIFVAAYGYINYFMVWAQNPNVPGAFNTDYVQIAQEINALPNSTPKYMVVNAGGVLARGIPIPAQTVMFLTESFTRADQQKHNIHYLLPNQTNQIPKGTDPKDIFSIN